VKISVPLFVAAFAASYCLAQNQPPTTAAIPAPGVVANPVLTVPLNKSIVLERTNGVRRISVSNPEIAEAVAVSATEILLNGKTAGETNLIVWDPKGNRTNFDVRVLSDSTGLDAIQSELNAEVGPGVTVTVDNKTVFLRGTVRDAITADRAVNIASALGKVVNLLRVAVPSSTPQILLKVRFATISRSAAEQLGFNVFSQNQKGIANATTTEFGQYPSLSSQSGVPLSFSDLLNIFYFRPDLNIGAYIQALEAKNILQVLAEPNLLTVSGEQASFLAGGEFPFPTIQGGAAGVGQITVQFKEFGIRLSFLPVVTPRGSILLRVMPEVSSLDYSNGLTVNGFNVPGLASRRVQTEVELENEQSFVIAGLLDKQVTEQLNKVPGLASIPVLGKLFESKSFSRSDTELLVVVTPELVSPIPAGAKIPGVSMPMSFGKDVPDKAPRTPGADVTGAPAPIQRVDTLPIEQLKSFTLQTTGHEGAQEGKEPSMSAFPPAQGGATSSPPPGSGLGKQP
jgi:pilus assembly protein CpaC